MINPPSRSERPLSRPWTHGPMDTRQESMVNTEYIPMDSTDRERERDPWISLRGCVRKTLNHQEMETRKRPSWRPSTMRVCVSMALNPFRRLLTSWPESSQGAWHSPSNSRTPEYLGWYVGCACRSLMQPGCAKTGEGLSILQTWGWEEIRSKAKSPGRKSLPGSKARIHGYLPISTR